LSAWRTKISNAMTKAHPVIGTEFVASQIAPGSKAAADRDPADEYPEMQRIST